MADVDDRSFPPMEFNRHPDSWNHWSLTVGDDGVATLVMKVDEEHPLRPGYVLQLNSYDMGVDVELADAVQRLRFEHPEVRCLVITSNQPKVFCAGANIYMLASSSHAWKVNFCKFTNETRCGLEDLTRNSGVHTIAALNGTASGGGYELALAAEEILLIDDGNSAVSLPEVPLLGVLPGTGGLTRLVDKRQVRRDIADLFCTKAEGFRTRDAQRYRLIDGGFPRSRWEAGVAKRAAAAVETAGGVGQEQGIQLSPVESSVEGDTRSYRYISLKVDEDARVATLTMRGPEGAPPESHEELHAQGDSSWLLAAFRELDDALLQLRFNHLTTGLLLLHTAGDAGQVRAHDAALDALIEQGSWLAREIRLFQARSLRRLDNMSRSMFALIDEGSCFAGSLAELALAADRIYMLIEDGVWFAPTLPDTNRWPSLNGGSRLASRYAGEPEVYGRLAEEGGPFEAEDAEELGLVTMAFDDIDWEDEVRIAIEERVSLSPDALTGMEQNLRSVGGETCDTKIYGRLSAWQNWIFQRPNAVGARGALTMYGRPERPQFDFRRT